MNETSVRSIFAEHEVILTDIHAVYTADMDGKTVPEGYGAHGNAYINKDAQYVFARETSELCLEMAVRTAHLNPDVVIAAAVGGVIIGHSVAVHLSELLGRDILSVYAEKVGDGSFKIGRGYKEVLAGKRVLVAEDVINSGGTSRNVVKLVRESQGEVVGVIALANRGTSTNETLDVPWLDSLLNVKFEKWDPSDCPQCKAGVPITTKVGKGAAYLKLKEEGKL